MSSASTASEIELVVASLTPLQAGALVIGPDAFFMSRSEQLASLTLQQRIPAIFQTREFAAAGGLISYVTNQRINTAKLGSTPVVFSRARNLPTASQQATKVELIINLKTAKALGLTVPPRCSSAPTR